jgi:hypothetical protein
MKREKAQRNRVFHIDNLVGNIIGILLQKHTCSMILSKKTSGGLVSQNNKHKRSGLSIFRGITVSPGRSEISLDSLLLSTF